MKPSTGVQRAERAAFIVSLAVLAGMIVLLLAVLSKPAEAADSRGRFRTWPKVIIWVPTPQCIPIPVQVPFP